MKKLLTIALAIAMIMGAAAAEIVQTRYGYAYEILNERQHKLYMDGESWMEEHNFRDGICYDCYFENPCAHERLSERVYGGLNRNEASYSKANDEGHVITSYKEEVQECYVCGEKWYFPEEKKSSEREPHNYQAGRCYYCDYKNPCEHEGVQTSDYLQDRAYSDPDTTHHTVTGHRVYSHYCERCGDNWSDAPEEALSSQREAHYFENGVCVNCGYENACEHGNVRSYEVWQGEETYLYERYDEKQHYFTGEKATAYECQDCGETWEDAPVTVGPELRDHYFKNGVVCDNCGHMNTCGHTSISSWLVFEDGSYSEIDVSGHTISGHACTRYSCNDCDHSWDGEMSEEIVSERQRHSFDEGGVCHRCAYENNCAHEDAQCHTRIQNPEYSQINETGHTVTGTGYAFYSCNICFYSWQEILPEEISERNEHHYDLDNHCIDCGYENPCLHERTSSHSYVAGDLEYFNADESGHVVRGQKYTAVNCEICHNTLSQTLSDEIIEETESHSFENGICRGCGYENSCAHEETTEEGYFLWDSRQFSDITPASHTISGEWWVQSHCVVCGEPLGEPVSMGMREQTETHYFDDGVCYECGYENVCAHENTMQERYGSWVDETALETTTQEHSGLIQTYEVVFCVDCGESLSETGIGEPELESDPHSYENGSCFICGYKNTCAHENRAVEEYGAWMSHNFTISGEGHSGMLQKYRREYCADCNETFVEAKNGEAEENLEAHAFGQGNVCFYCGYEK